MIKVEKKKVKKQSALDKIFIVTDQHKKHDSQMGRICEGSEKEAKNQGKTIFDCFLPMSDCAYDKGGAYWGMGTPVRVAYTKDLSYMRFYRARKRTPENA